MGVDEVSRWSWVSLEIWRGCEMMLATFSDPGSFVVVSLH